MDNVEAHIPRVRRYSNSDPREHFAKTRRAHAAMVYVRLCSRLPMTMAFVEEVHFGELYIATQNNGKPADQRNLLRIPYCDRKIMLCQTCPSELMEGAAEGRRACRNVVRRPSPTQVAWACRRARNSSCGLRPRRPWRKGVRDITTASLRTAAVTGTYNPQVPRKSILAKSCGASLEAPPGARFPLDLWGLEDTYPAKMQDIASLDDEAQEALTASSRTAHRKEVPRSRKDSGDNTTPSSLVIQICVELRAVRTTPC